MKGHEKKPYNPEELANLSDEELERLLAGCPDDDAAIDAVIGELLAREKTRPAGRLTDPEQAWRDFQAVYNTPEGEGLSLFGEETAAKKPRRPIRHLLKGALLAAALLACFLGGMVTAQSLNPDLSIAEILHLREKQPAGETVWIVIKHIHLRSEPTERSDLVAYVPTGTVVIRQGDLGNGWTKVTTGEYEGYLPTDSLYPALLCYRVILTEAVYTDYVDRKAAPCYVREGREYVMLIGEQDALQEGFVHVRVISSDEWSDGQEGYLSVDAIGPF